MNYIALPGTMDGIYIDKEPNKCPYCHKLIKPELKSFNNANDCYELIYKCPNDDCCKIFIAKYSFMRGIGYIFNNVNIGTIKDVVFSDTIKTISSNFIKIYNQAYFAEQNQLFEICGVGYRKALEFLIKDYLINKNPDNREQIQKKFLGNCISEDIENCKVKKVAKRAVWLGNDETHYIRKWEGKNLEDLKKLIQITLHWIEMDFLTEEVEEEMPE